MFILKVRYRTNREFLECVQDDAPAGALFCPTTVALEPATAVVCELVVPALPNKVLIRGVVRSWRPALPRLRVRAGAVIDFLAEEAEKRQYVLETVRGEREPGPRRRHTRLPVALPCRWKLVGTPEFTDGGLSEISVGGALLHAAGSIALGSELVLELTPPGAVIPIPIGGRVSYHAPDGAAGVKFHYRDGGGSRRLRELVRRLRQA